MNASCWGRTIWLRGRRKDERERGGKDDPTVGVREIRSDARREGDEWGGEFEEAYGGASTPDLFEIKRGDI